jgi:hypothetical protein
MSVESEVLSLEMRDDSVEEAMASALEREREEWKCDLRSDVKNYEMEV